VVYVARKADFKLQEALMDVEKEASRRAVIVTGGSGGIGAAIASRVGADGFPVAVNFRTNEAAAADVVREIESAGGRAVAIRGDISREDEILRLFETAERELGKIGGLVNNAAVTGGFTRVAALRADAIAQVLAVNVAGTMLCSREAVRRMSLRNGGLGGSIVNISSVSGLVGGHNLAAYNASKGAVRLLSKSVALHGARLNPQVRCNSVHPTFLEGAMTDALIKPAANPDEMKARMTRDVPLRRFGKPSEVAEMCVYLLSDESAFVTGAEFVIDGGLTAR